MRRKTMRYIPIYVEDIRTRARVYKIHVPDKFLEKFGLYTTKESEIIVGKEAFSRMMRLLYHWTLYQAAKEECVEFDKFCKEYKYE